MNIKEKISISYVPVGSLKPAEYNPRQANAQQHKDLINSMLKFGIKDPLIVNSAEGRKNIIIGGHFRLRVAKDIGFEEVPVVFVNIPDVEKERELNLRLNRNLGDWDFDLLAEFDESMLKEVGFDSTELDRIFQMDSDEKDDAVPETPEVPKTKKRDIYQLGRHRLMCGDSTNVDDVGKLMNERLADVVVTDPPYNTGMEGKSDAKVWLSHMFKDKFTQEEWKDLLEKFFNNYLIYTKGECAFYVFIDWRNVSEIKEQLEKRMDVKNVIVWDKVVHGLGSDYKFTYELCVVGKKGNPEINNRFGLDYQDIWRLQRQVGRNKDHATSKPVELLSKPIIHASKYDDIVLDLFLGSGSTLIACEKTNRICYGMELDPKYCDVIVKRWEDFTKKKAVLLNGQAQEIQ